MMQKNPWRGLLSYKDPINSPYQYKFCGRDAAVNSIFAMVDNNLLVTMYGKTGIGKTSILNAGVFPLLRSQQYFPISVRLGKYSNTATKSFAKHIVDEIAEEIHNAGFFIKTKYPEFADTNTDSINFLWRYFLTTTFEDKNGNEIYPVIALDQFEEVFINTPQYATLLMKQINVLLDDNFIVPDKEGYSDQTNYRFIISIREDDLFYLEDCIDINHLVEMKKNRYRLGPLTEQEANEVVRLGQEYIDKDVEDEIVISITNLAKDENGHISTNILSLVCSQLFIQSNGNINLETLNVFSENPLESFCCDCLNHIKPETITYIEQNLIDQDRRRFVSRKDMEKSVDSNDMAILMEGEYRIFQKVMAGNTECIELIHDSIAKTIYHLKNENEEQFRVQKLARLNRWKKIGLYVLSTILIMALCIIGWQYSNNIRMENMKGYGVKLSFAVSFQEDSLVTASNDYWEAKLLVIGLDKNNHKCDTLLDEMITKANRDSVYFFQADSVKNVRAILTYATNSPNYKNIDISVSIGQLSKEPNIKLHIEKNRPQPFCYSSQVVTNIDGHDYNLHDAIVILHDQMQRTDNNGHFTFYLEDTLSSSDILYVVRKGFNIYEDGNVVDKGKLIKKITLTPSDSLSTFEIRCQQMDSIINWKYRTATKFNPYGLNVKFEKQYNDKIILFGINDNSRHHRNDGFRPIKGFYYFKNEYERLKKQNRKYQAYHLFHGWIDPTDLLKTGKPSKPYELIGYDFVGNRQQISGLFTRKKGIANGFIVEGGIRVGTIGE